MLIMLGMDSVVGFHAYRAWHRYCGRFSCLSCLAWIGRSVFMFIMLGLDSAVGFHVYHGWHG